MDKAALLTALAQVQRLIDDPLLPLGEGQNIVAESLATILLYLIEKER